jgi:hypothetical protein
LRRPVPKRAVELVKYYIYIYIGKTTTLSLFLDSLFPKTEIPYMRDACCGDKTVRR